MILGREEIHRRLKNGEIFRDCTWDEKCLREASYVLRIAKDGLLLDGNFYGPGDKENRYQGDYIVIDPGKIAILSTNEELVMPSDLVGKIGIRLEFALLGLTGLMGIQVDPLYGHDKTHERLYIRVANFGNAPIRLSPGAKVFTFELHEVAGGGSPRAKERLLASHQKYTQTSRRCELVICNSSARQRGQSREGTKERIVFGNSKSSGTFAASSNVRDFLISCNDTGCISDRNSKREGHSQR